MNWYGRMKHAERTLYHGTTVDNAAQILQQGLIPTVGDFTSNAYEEYADAGITLPDLSFATDKRQLGSAMSAMMAAVAKKLGRNWLTDITLDELEQNGAIVVIKGSEGSGNPPSGWQHYDRNDNYWDRDTYPQVERGDYFTDGIAPVSYVLQGKKMVNFLMRHGEWPPDLEGSVPFMKKKLVEKQMPNLFPDYIRNRIDQLPDSEVSKQYQKRNVAAMAEPTFRVVPKPFGVFEAYLGKEKIGQAVVSQNRPGEFMLDAIDIFDHSEDGGVNYQRQGYGTQLMQYIARYLRAVGAKTLRSANEGSGTVQILDKVFGRPNVHHFHGGNEIDFDRAKHIMDVDYGRTLSRVDLPEPTPEQLENDWNFDDNDFDETD